MINESWVLWEYIHVDEYIGDGSTHWFAYEPFDYPALSSSIAGYIHIGSSKIPINGGRNNGLLLVGSDDVTYAGVRENSIIILWNHHPDDHFICVCYQLNSEKIGTRKLCWKKEGF